jgi:hypothetical protein
LSLVLVAPLYVALILFIFEVGFLFLGRSGVGYAAYAAARSAAVWDWNDPGGVHPRLAAWSALAPVAGASRNELSSAGAVPAEAVPASLDYAKLFDGSPVPVAPDNLARKFQNAAARTQVTVERTSANGMGEQVRVTVTYRAALRFPGVSRFLSPNRQAPFDYPLSSTVTLPSARPKAETGTLGIPGPSGTNTGGLP